MALQKKTFSLGIYIYGKKLAFELSTYMERDTGEKLLAKILASEIIGIHFQICNGSVIKSKCVCVCVCVREREREPFRIFKVFDKILREYFKQNFTVYLHLKIIAVFSSTF